MIVSRPLTCRLATPADWRLLTDLADNSHRVHSHLDWKPVNEWLGTQPFLLATDGDEVVGALACPPDPPEVGWIRLFAVADGVPAGDVLRALWPVAQAELERQRATVAAALAIEPWVGAALDEQGFRQVNEVVGLRRRRGPLPGPSTAPTRVKVRRVRSHDLAAIEAVDHTAFDPLWRISANALRAALAQSYYATAAERDGDSVGYQISTRARAGGHLARLAVLPALQGEGVASALVYDLLRFLERRGAMEITVNTQQDNAASPALYGRFGFVPTGERYAAWQFHLNLGQPA